MLHALSRSTLTEGLGQAAERWINPWYAGYGHFLALRALPYLFSAWIKGRPANILLIRPSKPAGIQRREEEQPKAKTQTGQHS